MTTHAGHVPGDISVRVEDDASGLLSVGGRCHLYQGASVPALTSVGGVPGKAIAVSDGYVLWAGTDGTYSAGCRGPFTLAEALAHWGQPREDERARIFHAAILAHSEQSK